MEIPRGSSGLVNGRQQMPKEGSITRSTMNRIWKRSGRSSSVRTQNFIKTYLLYSDQYSRRRDDTQFYAWKGLDPNLLKAIVQKAHAAACASQPTSKMLPISITR